FDLKSKLTQSPGKLSNMWFSYPPKLDPEHIDQAKQHTLTHVTKCEQCAAPPVFNPPVMFICQEQQ
ncbi:hypothetical protein DVA76_18210, partial [Acinetobacter baumannii]